MKHEAARLYGVTRKENKRCANRQTRIWWV